MYIYIYIKRPDMMLTRWKILTYCKLFSPGFKCDRYSKDCGMRLIQRSSALWYCIIYMYISAYPWHSIKTDLAKCEDSDIRISENHVLFAYSNIII